jgi:hypothetical protein
MTKEFIPYEQALALKELRFDEPCLGYYVGKDKEVYTSNETLSAPFKFRLESKTTFVAPLYQQAFSFLLNIIKDVSITYWNDESGNLKYFGQVVPFYDFDNRKECLSVLIEIAKKN